MTTPEGLVLAVFEFTDADGFLAQHRGAPRQIHRMLQAVVAGSADMADLLDEQARQFPLGRGGSSGQSIHLDNAKPDADSVPEIVADEENLLRLAAGLPNHFLKELRRRLPPTDERTDDAAFRQRCQRWQARDQA